jgi:hypothetical protein
VAGQDEPAGRGDPRVVHRDEQALDRVRGEDGVGVDGEGELGPDVGQDEGLRPCLGAGIGRWADDGCAAGACNRSGTVSRAVVNDDDVGHG